MEQHCLTIVDGSIVFAILNIIQRSLLDCQSRSGAVFMIRTRRTSINKLPPPGPAAMQQVFPPFSDLRGCKKPTAAAGPAGPGSTPPQAKPPPASCCMVFETSYRLSLQKQTPTASCCRACCLAASLPPCCPLGLAPVAPRCFRWDLVRPIA